MESETKDWLSEAELIEKGLELFKGQYDVFKFMRHVEINGCITDGLLFKGSNDSDFRIIGFEAKTDHDTYMRLYNQVNSYLTICDEVYLIVQTKELPKDLPFYVGVIRVSPGSAEFVRHATTLKHGIDAGDCWMTMLRNLNTHCEINRREDTLDFFRTVENIKRKLVWNQFIVGFRQSWTKDYLALSDSERNLFNAHFKSKLSISDSVQKSLIKDGVELWGF